MDGHLERLGRAEITLPKSPRSSVQDRHPIGEEWQTDVNHGLVWLLKELPAEQVRRQYGQPLKQLRDRSQGTLRRELQLALDVCGVEEHEEIERALDRMKEFRPRRAPAITLLGISALAFSRDGRFLALGGKGCVRVLDMHDRSIQACFAVAAEVRHLAFSPESRFLYLAGESITPCRYDWRRGQLVREFPLLDQKAGDKTELLELSAAGNRPAVLTRNKQMLVPSESGLRLDVFAREWGVAGFSNIHPSGKFYLDWGYRSLTPAGDNPENKHGHLLWQLMAAEKPRRAVREFPEASVLKFSPSGRHLLSLEKRAGNGLLPETAILRVHDLDQNCREVACAGDHWLGYWLAISSDGRFLVSAGEESHGMRFALFSLPDLKLIRHWTYHSTRSLQIRALELSGDGNTLALALEEDRSALYLFDTRTGRQILTDHAHPALIQEVTFPAGGWALRTRDRDGFVCLWDWRLRLLGRHRLPTNFKVLSCCPSNDKFLLGRFQHAEGKGAALGVVDADTGGRVCLFGNLEMSPEQILWPSDFQAVLIEGNRVVCVDCRRGLVLQQLQAESAPVKSKGEAAWCDGPSAISWLVVGDYSYKVQRKTLNLQTGKVSRTDAVNVATPGGETGAAGPAHSFLAYYPSPPITKTHLHLFGAGAFQLLAERRFAAATLKGTPLFAAEGLCFAVPMAWGEASDPNKRPKLLGIGQTHTGRLLGAIPLSEASRFFLSPNGRRLVIVKSDNTLELWDLARLDAG